MNDLINRKGAINAVCTVLYPDADKMNDAKKVLKEMPSAQPEVIRCKDCKDYQTDWETSYPNRHYCATMDSFMPEDGFCNYAERREG